MFNKKSITYPVAYNFKNNSIIDITDVTEDNKSDLSCPQCKEKFIPVLNHQSPHFKHKPNINCTGSLESYLHWLTKEVFKQIKEVEIPEINDDDLPEKSRQKFQQVYNNIVDSNISASFRGLFREGLNKNLCESKIVSIDKYDIEKIFKTEYGEIRADIVGVSNKRKIIIEPFFTNPIDQKKKKKLSSLNISTLSIDLNYFLSNYEKKLSLESLKKFLISKKSKKWIYLNTEKCNNHIKNYEIYLNQTIFKYKRIISSIESKNSRIESLIIECNEKVDQILKLKSEVSYMEEKWIKNTNQDYDR